MADSGYKSISRIDVNHKKMHGWYVRVYYKGVMHAKFFSDSRYDSREEGLAEAVLYRNALEEKLGKPRTERTVVSLSPRNTSGMMGIRRRRKKSRRGRSDGYDVFEVTWCPEPGKMKRTSVSIDKYGEETAYQMASEIREQKIRESYLKRQQLQRENTSIEEE
jgi:hypothetical protein